MSKQNCVLVQRHRFHWLCRLLLLVCLYGLLWSAGAAHASTYTVTNINDSGAGSLRQAILNANASSGPDVITFNLGAGVQKIRPTSPLPAITDTVEINALASPCSTWPPQPRVELDGSLAGANADGFNVQANNSRIIGLYINRFTQDGIEISAANVIVACNIIGLDAAGAAAGNAANGVLISGGSNIVGHFSATVGNVISANSNGLFIWQPTAANNSVRGNRIGTDNSGLQDRGNLALGIFLGDGATDNLIGGATASDRNLIAGNNGDGVHFEIGTTSGNQVLGNWIGLAADGATALPNTGAGVLLSAASNNVIGGLDPGQGNVIAHNGTQGVVLYADASNNPIFSNQIHSNGQLGIDLGGDGVNANDLGDGDSGSNLLQNSPVISEAYRAGEDATVVRGSLNSTANTQYRIQLFANDVCDSSGAGEGADYLGDARVGTDASGNTTFTLVVERALPAGQRLTATATDGGEVTPFNTSEFSVCKAVDEQPPAIASLPLPRSDSVTTTEDTAITIDVLANDRDPNSDPLTLVAVGKPSAGTAQIVNNKILFTPAVNFSGDVAFFYSLHDGNPDNTVQTHVRVQVTPLNDAPSDISLGISSVFENQPANTVVGILTAVDVDDSSDFSFSLTGTGNDNALFQIVGSQLLARSSFDFETKASYMIRVRVSDSRGATFDKDLAVTISNANDAPTAINLSNNRIDENQAAGLTVGSFSSLDPDAGNSHTYALVGGSGADDNSAFRLEGATLKTNSLLDYEAKPIYSIRMRSADNTGASREQIFAIYLNNLASPPDALVNTLAHCSGNPITLLDANTNDANKRVLVKIESIVISNKLADSCTVTGKLTVISNGNTVNNLAFSGTVNNRNQFSSSTIPDFQLSVAGLPLLARGVQIEYYVERPSLRITQPALKMPDDWGGLAAPLSIPTLIDNNGVKFGTATINLPTIKTKSGFELDLSGSLVPVAGGYQINADGSLAIPNIGKKKTPGSQGQTCTISAGVTIYAGAQGQTVMEIVAGSQESGVLSQESGVAGSQLPVTNLQSPVFADTIRLDKIRAGFSCDQGIAIGTTGLFLTSLSGEITLTPNNEAVNVQVKIVAGKKLPVLGPVIGLDGTMDLKLRPDFRLDLGVALNVLSFKIANANAAITKTSFSTTININAVILHGTATINAWSTDGKFHFTGSGRMAIEVRKGSIAESCTDFPCRCNTCWKWGFIPYPCQCSNCPICLSIPPFNTGRLAEVGVDVGEFSNGRYGFKGYVGVAGQTVGFYVDESGSLSFSNIEQYRLIQGPTVAAVHQAWLEASNAQMSVNTAAFADYTFLDDGQGNSTGVIIRTPLVKPTLDLSQVQAAQASDVISKVNLVQHGDVAFTLKARGALAFTLITPQGQEVTPANFNQSGTLGYVIVYTQSVRYEAEDNQDESTENDPTLPRLRFTPLSSDAAVNGVDLRIDGAAIYSNVYFDSPEALEPIVLPPGAHTVELVKSGTNNVVLSSNVTLISNTDYSLLTVPLPPSVQAATPQAAPTELVMLVDNNSAPATLGQAKLRFYNAAGANLNMLLNGVPLFSNIGYKALSAYEVGPAGTYTIELRYTNNTLASQPLVVDLADGGVYTFFSIDYGMNGYAVASLQRQDVIYTPSYLVEYAVDQAKMNEEWQVKLVGDTDNTPYVVSVAGPASPPVLASVTVDASNPAAAQVSWRLTSDLQPTRVKLYINPGAISKSLTITNPVSGIVTTQETPIFEGYPVAEFVISDLAQLGGQLVTKPVDLAKLASGSYHLWLRAEDGVNPPVNVYAAAPTVLASGVQDAYGVNAVRVAQEGYDPLRQLADAATITINNGVSFPTTWNATISTALAAAAAALYIEWLVNPHPDVDNYRLHIGNTPLNPTQVITAGGAVVEYDGNGLATGAVIGFSTLQDIQPGMQYFLAVEAVDTESGRTVRSQEVNFNASAGNFALTTPQTTLALLKGGAATVPITLNELQPLFYPQVSLSLDLGATPLGITAGFVNEVEGLTTLSPSQPTAQLQISVDAAVADGRYPLVVTGYNGATKRTLTIEIVVGNPTAKVYLPVVRR